jgi:hypothetical protein
VLKVDSYIFIYKSYILQIFSFGCMFFMMYYVLFNGKLYIIYIIYIYYLWNIYIIYSLWKNLCQICILWIFYLRLDCLFVFLTVSLENLFKKILVNTRFIHFFFKIHDFCVCAPYKNFHFLQFHQDFIIFCRKFIIFTGLDFLAHLYPNSKFSISLSISTKKPTEALI